MFKRFVLLIVLSFFCTQNVFAKQEKNLYVVKNIEPENIIQELVSSVPNAVLDKNNNIVYSNADAIYYFKVYKYENDSEIFAYTTNGNLESIIKQLSQKAYPLMDRATINKYNNDFLSYAKINSLKSIKFKEKKNKNLKYNSYNPYMGKLKNKVLETTTITQDNITIERKKLMAKTKVKHYTYEYVYNITNNTGKDITIKKVASAEFIGLSQIAAYCIIPRGKDFIPIYGLVYSVQTDLEKNKFTRPHPRDELIKNGDTMRVLALAKLQDNPVVDFVFTIDNKEIVITYK